MCEDDKEGTTIRYDKFKIFITRREAPDSFYILNNADEIAEYRKQATLSTYSKDINGHFLIGSEIRSSKCVTGTTFRMISSHLRWDIHLTFDPTLDASWVSVDGTMSNFLAGFDESDDLFNFNVEEFNIVPDTSSVGDTSYAFQPIAHTPRRREHSRNLNNTISVNTTFLVHFLKWDDMTPGYTELVKGGLQFMLNFTGLALTCSLLSIKRLPCRRTSRGAEPLPFQEHELTEQRGHLIDRMELFKKKHARDGQFISQATTDVHNQMLELQSQSILEGSQPLSRDEIC
ncbi:CACTA en-spm transposon protein [Cucumis melo var. makuwa]|uniref:CACTA en-spm transposon protein n=1 Tax=Cucumis melo var. makuwa TaxID=1194695 RepID=A0A5A7V8F9_CUCMM|nr:CACTA en-spm transposon protein [Cucumis melo var. makuwa]